MMVLVSRMLLFILTAAGMNAAPGCGGYNPPGDLRTVRMQIGTGAFTLEVADTDASRRLGLMRRDSMPRNHGMIFVFPDEQVRGFWMKNVRFALDIIFLDAEGRVVSIHQMQPYDESTTRSDGPARYAIELNQGVAAAVGVKPGDLVNLPPEVRKIPGNR